MYSSNYSQCSDPAAKIITHNSLSVYGGGVMCASPSTAPGFFNPRPQSGAELSAFDLGLSRSMTLGVPPHSAWHDPSLGGHLHASSGPGGATSTGGGGGGTTPSSVASQQSTVIKQDLSGLTASSGNLNQSGAHHVIKEDLSSLPTGGANGGSTSAHHTTSGQSGHNPDLVPIIKGSQSASCGGGGGGGGGSTTPSSQANSSHSQSSNSGSQIDSKQNIECVVCGDKSSGKHYGQFTCEGESNTKSKGCVRGVQGVAGPG